jgi:hypothetical protein
MIYALVLGFAYGFIAGFMFWMQDRMYEAYSARTPT